jgi:hypothetical protein
VSRNSTGWRSSLGGDEKAARPLLQGRMSDVEQAETVIVECKNIDTGCIELLSVNAKHFASFFWQTAAQ